MPPTDWPSLALRGTPVWSIGQLEPADRVALDALVRKGRLAKVRASFMGISRPKSVWVLPAAVSVIPPIFRELRDNADGSQTCFWQHCEIVNHPDLTTVVTAPAASEQTPEQKAA